MRCCLADLFGAVLLPDIFLGGLGTLQWFWGQHTCAHTHIHTNVFVGVCICIYIYIYICMYVCIYGCMLVYTYKHIANTYFLYAGYITHECRCVCVCYPDWRAAKSCTN